MRAIQSRRAGAILLATLLVAVNGLAALFRGESAAPLGAAVGATAILTFFGMLLLAQESGAPWKITESAMRTAIASSILAEYQALVAIAAFLGQGTDPLPGLVSNFTTIVGIVVAFYFGASAFVETRRGSATSDPSTSSGSSRATSRDEKA